MCNLDPVFSSELYFTYPLSEVEIKRKQRDAVLLLRSIGDSLGARAAGGFPVLIVTNHDLFAEGANFVFGIANPRMGLAVMSTIRLTQWFEGITPSIIQERILKQAAHEVGHLAGLVHCTAKACPMAQSTSLRDIDEKLPVFCGDCRLKLRKYRFS